MLAARTLAPRGVLSGAATRAAARSLKGGLRRSLVARGRGAGGAAAVWSWRGLSGAAAPQAAKAPGGGDGGGGIAGMVGGRPEDEEPSLRLKDILAHPNPANHRPGDAGKIYQIKKEELQKLFPLGISGALHQILFGTRSRLPQNLRRQDDWWNVILKQSPGILIRKEATHLMSALYCLSKTGVEKGEPHIPSPGFLIDGAKGTGKSTLLNHVVHWAVKSGAWLVLYVPHASDIVAGKGFFEREGDNGSTILQPALAMQYLNYFLAMNPDKFAELPLGGSTVAAAITSLNEKPIVEREAGAMPLFEEVMDVMRAQTKFPLLVAIDEFNALHGVSLYRDLDLQFIPASQVKMANILGRFLDADYKRGLVVGAAVRQGQFQHVRFGNFRNTPIQLKGFSVDEIHTYITYMHIVQDMFTPPTKELVEYLKFTTDGRPLDLEKACAHELFNLGLRNDSPRIKNTRFYLDGGYEQDLICDPAIPDSLTE